MLKTPAIYSQGSLDGACFLYAIANAYMTLTNERFENSGKLQIKWNNAIQNIPYFSDFILYDVGTARYNIGNDNYIIENNYENSDVLRDRGSHQSYKICSKDSDDNMTLFLLAARIILYELSKENERKKPQIGVELLPVSGTLDSNKIIGSSIDKKSVLVATIEKENHWICFTGKSASTFEVACSWFLLNPERNIEYDEKVGFAGRIYNREIPINNANIVEPIFKITKFK